MRWNYLLSVARCGLTGALLAALLAACGRNHSYVPPPPPKVDVALPIEQNVQRYLTTTGGTIAVNSTTLVARVQGFIQSIDYEDGDRVKKGAVLFVIEPEPYQLALTEAQASQAAAEADVVQSDKAYRRQAELVARNATSRQDLDNAAAQRDSDRAKLRQAQAGTKQAEINLSYTQVKAPFDGIVTARQVSVGELVGAGGAATVLASIVQLDPIYAQFSISQADVQRIRAKIAQRGLTPEDLKKIPVEIGLETENGYPHKGMLDYAAPSVSSTTGTLLARAVFSNPRHVLLPGYFARVRVPLGIDPNRLLVPDRALGSDQGGRYLLVLGKNDTVEQRPVKIGRQVGELRVIESGIGAGDKILVSGLMTAVPGEKVDPQMKAIQAAAATGQ